MKSSSSPLSLADALWPKTRQRVLGVLFGQPGRSFYANELIGLTRSGSGAVQRELVDLTQVGLLTCTRVGHQTHYQANPASPVFQELRGLVMKTVGLGDILREALRPVAHEIAMAWVFGSVARGDDTVQSDIDLMVVSDQLGYAPLMLLLEAPRQTLGREIEPQIYGIKEFQSRRLSDNAFVQRVMQQPKIWLMGEEESHEPPGSAGQTQRTGSIAQARTQRHP